MGRYKHGKTLLIVGVFSLLALASGAAIAQQALPSQQTDLTISMVLLPETTTPGGEFGSQTRVMIYNQGTTIIEGGFFVEMIISSDRDAPIAPAEPTTTFAEDGLLPNGRVEMPTILPENTYSFSIPGMTMVPDAPLDGVVFICAIVDPDDVVNEEWRGHHDGYGVNKLCAHIDVVPGSENPEPPAQEPPSEEPPTSGPPPPPITNSGELAGFDSDGDCQISDAEFFAAIDLWIGEEIDDARYFAVVDAWISDRPVCTPGAGAGLSCLLSVQRTASGSLTFSLADPAAGLELAVFDAQGRLVIRRSSQGGRLSWNLRNAQGQPLASGVYFYKLSAQGSDGQIYGSPVRKLALLR